MSGPASLYGPSPPAPRPMMPPPPPRGPLPPWRRFPPASRFRPPPPPPSSRYYYWTTRRCCETCTLFDSLAYLLTYVVTRPCICVSTFYRQIRLYALSCMTPYCNTNPCLRDVVTETQHCKLRLKQTLHCHLMQLRELGDWNFGSPPRPCGLCGKLCWGLLGDKVPRSWSFYGHLGHAASGQMVNTANQSCIGLIHLIRVVNSRKAIFWTVISTNK